MPSTRTLALTAVTLALGAHACTTDTKASDAGGAHVDTAPTDGGAVLVAHEGHVDAGLVDAGPFPDAGEPPVVPVDGGSATTTASATSTGAGEAPKGDGTKDGAKGAPTPFDRILAKPKTKGADVDALRALVEQKTGAKVESVRKMMAGKWLLFSFAPAKKARDAGDQQKLIEALKAMDEFASVEADRVVTVKQP